jgi:hypothetical protein
LSWHARGAPVNFHLHGTVCSRFNDTPYSVPYFSLPIVTLVNCRIFWAFDILPSAEGSKIDPTKTVNRGMTREPAPFQLRVRTRHPDVERIIESESADADLRLKEWEY